MRLKRITVAAVILSVSLFLITGCKKDNAVPSEGKASTENEENSNDMEDGSEEDLTVDLEDAYGTLPSTDTQESSDTLESTGTKESNGTEESAGADEATKTQGDANKQTDGRNEQTGGSTNMTKNNNETKTGSTTVNNHTTEKQTTTKASGGNNEKVTYSVASNNFNVDTGISVHDPAIIKANGKYYIFGSHLAQASTTNLGGVWSALGVQGYSNSTLYGGPLATALARPYEWAGKQGDTADSSDSDRVWAPDVIWNPNYVWSDGSKGAYMLYSCTTATYIRSCIIYSVSKNVEGPYTYVDTIIYSGFSNKDAYDSGSTVNKNVANTNVPEIVGGIGNVRASYFNSRGDYNSTSFPNAIDPNVFFDAKGQLWMTYGSWSGGIWITKLNNATGQPIHDYPQASGTQLTDVYFGKQIAGGGGVSGEAPYVLYDSTSGYYYLFMSYGSLNATGGYNIRLFRSKNPDGPYTDAAGKDARSENINGKYVNESHGVKFLGGYDFPSLKNGYLAPGHNSAFIDDNGKKYVVYHTRFENNGEWHFPRVHQMFVNEQGWLCVAPFQTSGETIAASGYGESDIAGTYYVVLQTVTNNTTAASYKEIKLNSDKTVSGAYSGTWSYTKGTYYMQINIGGVQYYGVFLQMKDEAQNNCMTFSATGTNNQTLMAVKYLN